MTRPKRINLPFSLYHVMSRTNSGELAFWDRRDYQKFLHYVEKYTNLFSFRLHTYCLMPNHFHLLLESTNQAALSELMRRLLTAYTVYFNRRYHRHGHLFQGRFKSIVVDKAEYLLAVSRYIHTNPAVMQSTSGPETYKWSSFRYYVNGGEPRYLHTQEILHWFEGNRKRYAQFVKEGINEETKPQIVQQRYIGNETFVHRMNQRMTQLKESGSRATEASRRRDEKRRRDELKKADAIIKEVAKYIGCKADKIRRSRSGQGQLGIARAISICLLRDNLSWTNRQIAEYMNLRDKSGVNYHQRRLRESRTLSRIFKTIEKEIK